MRLKHGSLFILDLKDKFNRLFFAAVYVVSTAILIDRDLFAINFFIGLYLMQKAVAVYRIEILRRLVNQLVSAAVVGFVFDKYSKFSVARSDVF